MSFILSCSRRSVLLLPILSLVILLSPSAQSAGDLTQRPDRLPVLTLGKLTETELLDYFMAPTEYRLETGKSYRLKVQASGLKEYALQAPEFFSSIYIRKVEAGGVEIKGVGLSELEFEEEGEAEIFFVPIRSGEFSFYIKGHEKRGMTGVFIVE
ncbi:MAG: copper-binding protein [Marinospirillum sp.]|uniref:copper-binding protein n=1 Tax=Marinospirillum sp. TaxID=2183934 RepID=UPI0019F37476|nr:copper-binding protein [Marinospirillum sp.]MBE0505637.1 copper-binding protein [Marinospirillum sp.]